MNLLIDTFLSDVLLLSLDMRGWVGTVWSVWLFFSSVLKRWGISRDEAMDFLIDSLLADVLLLLVSLSISVSMTVWKWRW